MNKNGNGWLEVPLGELCRLINGKSFTPNDWTDSGLPIIRIQNLNDATKSFNYWAGSIERQVMVNRGDVLLGWSGTPGTSFGAHHWKREQGVLNQHIFRVDLDETRIAKEWAVPAINHQLEVLIGKAHGGVGLRHVKKAEVESLLIPLPPLTEQKRIAGILKEQLAAVERARAAVETQLEAAKLLHLAYMRNVLGTNGSRNWYRDRLGNLCTVVRGSSPRPKDDRRFYGGNVPRLMVEDCTRDGMHVTPKIDFLTALGAERSRPMKVGDVVIVVSGNPGMPAILAVDCCIHDGFVGLRNVDAKRIDNAFLYHFLLFNKARTDVEATGAIFRNLTTTQIGALEIAVPPLQEQRRIVAFLRDRAVAEKELQTKLESLVVMIEALPKSMLRSAFRGEL